MSISFVLALWSLALFFVAGVLSVVCTHIVRSIAKKSSIVDIPSSNRKIHYHPIPLLGGVAVFCAIAGALTIGASLFGLSADLFRDAHVTSSHVIGSAIGAIIIMICGALDDKYSLYPSIRTACYSIAALSVVASGVVITQVTNPFGGIIFFGVLSPYLTFVWLLAVMFAIKVFDGLDGLVSGVTVIGSLIIALLSIFLFVNVPTAFLAAVSAGAFAGFLFFNMHPASIFLGESGSTLAGFLLGTLAIISGAKLATVMLILGIPLADFIWIMVRRMVYEHRSPFSPDRKHLHFRLLDAGLSHRAAVCVLCGVSGAFGISALFLQSAQKAISLSILAGVCVLLYVLASKRSLLVKSSDKVDKTATLK